MSESRFVVYAILTAWAGWMTAVAVTVALASPADAKPTGSCPSIREVVQTVRAKQPVVRFAILSERQALVQFVAGLQPKDPGGDRLHGVGLEIVADCKLRVTGYLDEIGLAAALAVFGEEA